jgi:hypothetical protein
MSIDTGAARASAGLIALIGWVGLAVQLSALTDQAGSAAGAIWIMLRFFTILTNLIVAVVFTGIALGQPAFRSQSLLGLMTLSILFVGAVYVLLLRGLVELSGGAATANLILHYIVPSLTPLFWLLFAPKGALKWRDPLLWALYPLAYFAYALLRGALDGKYPYPFMDIPKVGWASALTTVSIILIAYLLVGSVFVWLSRLLDRSQSPV